MDPIEFLSRHPPFDRLDRSGTRRLSDSIEIAYAPRDTRVLRRDGPLSKFLYVVRKGAVRLEREGQLVQTIEEGECFGFPSLIGRAPPTVDAVAAADTLLYQVPEAAFAALMEQPAFAEFFLVDLNERLRRTAALRQGPVGGELTVAVGRLPVTPPLTVSPDTTIGEAARRMRDAGVSSLLVEGEPQGILTDRDLRSRVLAEGRGPATRVADVRRCVGPNPATIHPIVWPLKVSGSTAADPHRVVSKGNSRATRTSCAPSRNSGLASGNPRASGVPRLMRLEREVT